MLPDLSDLKSRRPTPSDLFSEQTDDQLWLGLRALRQFLQSQGHPLFLQSLQAAIEMGEQLLDAPPQSLGDVINREQFIGARENIRSMQTWFETTVMAIEHTLEQRKLNKEEQENETDLDIQDSAE